MPVDNNNGNDDNKEACHYVVTAHPPGGVLATAKCSFVAPNSSDVLVFTSQGCQVKTFDSTDRVLRLVTSFPLWARIVIAEPLVSPSMQTNPVWVLTERQQYAVLAYNNSSNDMDGTNDYHNNNSNKFGKSDNDDDDNVKMQSSLKGSSNNTNTNTNSNTTTVQQQHDILTLDSGTLPGTGRVCEAGPLVAIHDTCVAVHAYEGVLTIIPINADYVYNNNNNNTAKIKPRKGKRPMAPTFLLEPFSCRLEEHVLLCITFLHQSTTTTGSGSSNTDMATNNTTFDKTSGHDDGSSDDSPWPLLAVLHQDARGIQHVTTYIINLQQRQIHFYKSPSAPANTPWLQRTAVDGGSSALIALPKPVSTVARAATATAAMDDTNDVPDTGGIVFPTTTVTTTSGVLILGQRQITYLGLLSTKILPVPQALWLTHADLPPDPHGMPRYLLGDEFGNLHLLTVVLVNDKVVALQLETLGSCTLSTSLVYLSDGLVFVASTLGDSQLVQIHDNPLTLQQASTEAAAMDNSENAELADSTYLTVVEEYTNLGPILDMALVTPGVSSNDGNGGSNNNNSSSSFGAQVVTASGSSQWGTLRLVRNGIGMKEYAQVEIPGIQQMWRVRRSVRDSYDTYLVQAFVGETRVLGVVAVADSDQVMHDDDNEMVSGTLEEVELPGFLAQDTTLYVGNVQVNDRLLQITSTQVRLVSWSDGSCLDSWSPDTTITLATANEAGQIALALPGAKVVYLKVDDSDKIVLQAEQTMERDVSCLDLHPFSKPGSTGGNFKNTSSRSLGSGKKSTHFEGAEKSDILAVGLWDDFTVRLLSLDSKLDQLLKVGLSSEEDEDDDGPSEELARRNRNNMMARSLSLVSLDHSSAGGAAKGSSSSSNLLSDSSSVPGVNMLFVGLGDGTLISFAVSFTEGKWSVHSKKEVCLGSQCIQLVPLTSENGGACVLATGDRPTVVYLAGVGGSLDTQYNPKLCYSNVNLSPSDDYDEGQETDDVLNRPRSQHGVTVNVAAPFYSPQLFEVSSGGNHSYSLCIADDSHLRLGVIDDIQKLHVTTCRLGMAPRRVVHSPEGRMFAVGCIESGIKHFGLGGDEANMSNCIRFMDDTSFDDIYRVDLEPYEMILSIAHVHLKINTSRDEDYIVKPYIVVGTAYALPDEDEATRGRLLVYSCLEEEDAVANTSSRRNVRQVTELLTHGGVYSICQFYDGRMLYTVNSKCLTCEMTERVGVYQLQNVGIGHHGHIVSLNVKSLAKPLPLAKDTIPEQSMAIDVEGESKTGREDAVKDDEQLAIVGDLVRSVSLLQYYPQHSCLEEVARDFYANWTTSVEMLNDNAYLGSETWNNMFCLQRNKMAVSDEVRCRLDTIGEFHFGEMINKFLSGSLVVSVSSSTPNAAAMNRRRTVRRGTPKGKPDATRQSSVRVRRPLVSVGSQTLFGTVDGTLGVVLGIDRRTAAYFTALEKSMATVIKPIGNFSHDAYRSCHGERRVCPAYGFVDGDLVESFLDLDYHTMDAVVKEMNRKGGWEYDDSVLTGGEKKEEGRKGSSGDADMELDEDIINLTIEDVLAMVEEISMLH